MTYAISKPGSSNFDKHLSYGYFELEFNEPSLSSNTTFLVMSNVVSVDVPILND